MLSGMGATIEIIYKCVCMADEVKLDVPARRGPSVDVTLWVEDVVGVKVGEDHRQRSPRCLSTKMEFLKIPLPRDTGYVGEARA
jgi:hypothetical protein